jgi:hydroxymethylpyrimidine kinase/phosphomethylpyrimidine kinase/thiamine-phosphate diphosphorylase
MNDYLLTIAGSDPSGGAGIQQDMRVFEALGGVGLTVVTALTVQNSRGVLAVHPIPADVLFDQIEALLEETPVGAVKIGMLGGAEQVRAVAEALRRFPPPHIVLDPVLASTGGVPLLDEEGEYLLRKELLPLCTLLTPNLPELARLSGSPVTTDPERERAAHTLMALGVPNVLVKGGHLDGAAVDVLHFVGGRRDYTGVRLDTPHTHGTGCFLSSAIAAVLARGESLPAAVEYAKRLLTDSLRYPVVPPTGRGFPDVRVGQALREIERIQGAGTWQDANVAERLRGVYVLTDAVLHPERDAKAIVRAALAGGAKIVQLRDKRLPTAALIALATELQAMARDAGAVFLVNDRVDVALASGAEGVHLGPDDMSPREARLLLGPHKIIGVSVSTVEEARPLLPFASYFGVGAVYGTATKQDAGAAIGVGRLTEFKRAYPQMPLAAIGGIGQDNIGAVGAAGADMAAVVSAVVAAPDMRRATEELVVRFR